MDMATAQELIRLAEVSKASSWIRHDLSPHVAEILSKNRKLDLKPSVVQPLDPNLSGEEKLLRTIAGEPTDIVVLGKDYYGENQLREDHINFVVLSAHHVAELAKFWLEHRGR
jgi:hypothetical protein